MSKLEKEEELEAPMPVVPARIWQEIKQAKVGRYVVVGPMSPLDWEEKLLDGFFRALEWLELPVKVRIDTVTTLVFGQGLTWKEAEKMWKNRRN